MYVVITEHNGAKRQGRKHSKQCRKILKYIVSGAIIGKQTLRRTKDVNMTEQQRVFLDKKIEEYTQKTKLKKPKLIIKPKMMAPAAANFKRNEVSISRNLLLKWQKGIYDDRDVEAILAHEFGHLTDYSQKTWFERQFKCNIQWYVAIFVTIYVLGAMILSIVFGAIVFLASILLGGVGFLWAAYLPWIIRKTFVPLEFAADKNAIAFNLVEAQQYADSMTKRIGNPLPEISGPEKTLEFIENRLSHPSIYEEFHNIGFEIERPIRTKRISVDS